MKRRILTALVLLMTLVTVTAAAAGITVYASEHPVTKNGWYSGMEEVAVYLATYGQLPGNYLFKGEAQRLGWDSSLGNLWQVANGKSIGGDRYGNYEGRVPDARGRTWRECDIDFDGGYRGPKRIIYSNDGLIYYTKNHYKTFDEVTVILDSPTPTPKKKATATPKKATPAPRSERLISTARVEEGESYTAWDEVAAYLSVYGELPINYISLEEAQELGFVAKKDNMGEVAPEFAIGGGSFRNKEGLLPSAKGRTWTECDVDMKDGKRGNHRLVFSNDGLIFLTRDRFKSFTEVEVR